MIKRMAGRFGSHLGHISKHEEDQLTPQLASSSAMVQQHILANSLGQGTITHTPTHTPGHSQTHFDHRGSISTERTSFSDLSKRGDSLDVLPEEPMQPRLVKKTRGSYKLADFVIQRTLGTGSFGRVHLGAYPLALLLLLLPLLTGGLQCKANTISDSTPSRC